jgi:hypothetical protein
MCAKIAKNSIDLKVLETPVEACPGGKLICQMINICAGETTVSHVMHCENINL